MTYFSDDQIQTFRERGYLVARGLFGPREMSNIARWTEEIVSRPEVPGAHMVYYEDSLLEPGRRVLSRIENFCAHHPGFSRLLEEGEVGARLAELFGERAVLFKDKINFKLPGADGFKAHQDVQAGWNAYASLHITMMVSIDETTAANGYLELAPGARWHELVGALWEPLDERTYPDMRYEPCPTQPGDAVFFDSFVPHRSAPNRTAKPRRVLYVTYNRLAEGDQRARYYADKRKNYPPDCERDPAKRYVFRV